MFLRDVAHVSQGESETKSVVDNSERMEDGAFKSSAAVTVAVAKKRGSNGIDVAAALTKELAAMKGTLIPDLVEVTVTRDYGESAHDKVSHLIIKLFIVSALVTVLAFLTMGPRPALIVAITIPAVLLMSLAVAYVLKFTINRVSMFALVFAIGILVDDAIVVVENIYRRWLESGETSDEVTIDAVDEVGNPTILATFTVVAALLPMGFVSDMMGPYMLPIPVLSSAAMIFSLFAAFVFVPWLSARVKPSMATLQQSAAREHRQAQAIGRWYNGVISPIMDNRLIGYNDAVPASSPPCWARCPCSPSRRSPSRCCLTTTSRSCRSSSTCPRARTCSSPPTWRTGWRSEIRKIPEVTAYQTYVGASSPFNFNGLVRHYFLRAMPWQGDIAVQLLDKSKRSRSSHEIATLVRATLTPMAAAIGARLTIAEAPPGPPVLAPMVIELYGPTPEIRRKVANDLLSILRKTPDIADINTFMERPHDNLQFEVDRLRASMFGVAVEDINREIAMATGGFEVGALQSPRNLEQAVIVLQAPMATRGNIGNLLVMPLRSQTGAMVPLGELGRFVNKPVDPVIYHKDLRALEYVTADVVGRLGAPLYGMLNVDAALKNYVTPDGQVIGGHYFGRPADANRSGFKWDGEWEVTYVTFRDMGLAFGAALVLIYILVVAEFKKLHAAGRGHGADPADADRHHSRPLAARRRLHRDIDDRLHRARRHHRPKFHPAGGVCARKSRRGPVRARFRGHGRTGAAASDPDHSHGAGDRLDGASERSDLPGHGGVAAVRLVDRHVPDPDRHPARLRVGGQIFWREEQWRRGRSAAAGWRSAACHAAARAGRLRPSAAPAAQGRAVADGRSQRLGASGPVGEKIGAGAGARGRRTGGRQRLGVVGASAAPGPEI